MNYLVIVISICLCILRLRPIMFLYFIYFIL